MKKRHPCSIGDLV